MTKRIIRLTFDEVNCVFNTNLSTGEVWWKNSGRGRRLDLVAGCVDNGYWSIGYKGVYYGRAHIIWMLANKEWPKFWIDHINHNRQDDKITNLRDVPRIQNDKNRSLSPRNKTGHNGLTIYEGKRVGKRYMLALADKHIGTYSSIEEFLTAREYAYEKLGYHPNHGT